MAENQFQQQMDEAVDFFNSFNGSTIRVISHLDADGICAAAILVNTLNDLGLRYSITSVPQLDENIIETFAREKDTSYVFADLGSSHIAIMKKKLSGKKVLVLDHHKTTEDISSENIMDINPHHFSINGSKDISGAGVVYLFTKKLNQKKDEINMSYLAIVGAIGDNQEISGKGFTGLNNAILDDAVRSKKMVVRKGLRLFGALSRPLFKLIRNGYDPYIPGVSGSDSGTREFLKSVNIPAKVENSWRMLSDLSDAETARLTKAIMAKSKNLKKEDVFGNVYTIPGEDGALGDAREFSTILNSCGRMGKAGVGIAACLGDDKMKKKAVRSLTDYRKEISNSISWYEDNKGTENVLSGDNYILLNSGYNILPSIAGTIASVLSHSNDIDKGTFIVTMSRTDNRSTKVSMRMAGGTRGTNVDVRKVLCQITDSAKGQCGGHKNAAGAMIPSSKEKQFITAAKELFSKLSMEEEIN